MNKILLIALVLALYCPAASASVLCPAWMSRWRLAVVNYLTRLTPAEIAQSEELDRVHDEYLAAERDRRQVASLAAIARLGDLARAPRRTDRIREAAIRFLLEAIAIVPRYNHTFDRDSQFPAVRDAAIREVTVTINSVEFRALAEGMRIQTMVFRTLVVVLEGTTDRTHDGQGPIFADFSPQVRASAREGLETLANCSRLPGYLRNEIHRQLQP